MIMKILLLSGVLCLFSFVVKSQERYDLNSFESLNVSGKIEIRLVESDKSYLQLSSGTLADENLAYEIKKDVLSVYPVTAVTSDKKVKIELGFKDLSSIVVGGGVLLYNRDTLKEPMLVVTGKSGGEVDLVLNVDSLSCTVNKGAFVRLQGNSRVVSLKTSTGGDYRGTQLIAETMFAKINGGSAEVGVLDYLEVDASMKGSLRYVEAPKKIKKKEKLGASVGKLEDF